MELRDSSSGRVARGGALVRSARRALKFGCVALLILNACGENNTSGQGGTGGGAGTSGAGSATGGASSTGNGGASSGGASMGGASSGGTSATGTGGSGTGGSTTSVGSGGTTTSSGGTSAVSSGGSKSSGGTTSSGSGGSAGSKASGGSSSGGTASSGGSGSTGDCTRELLKGTVDAYFKALATHDPSTLPLADNVKFTENGKAMKMGDGGLWKTAGTLKYAHSALDTVLCSTSSEAVVPDGSTDLPFALRLKLQNQKITEVETIAVRAGDYKVSGSNFASNPAAIISSDTTVKWEETVPAAQRNTREELMGWIEKYFKIFPKGVCNTTSDCKRLENGGGSFNCSAGASCDASTGTGQPVLPYHVIMADEETGVGVGWDMFMGNTDMHIFKMYGGKVYAVHAILGAATSSGWD